MHSPLTILMVPQDVKIGALKDKEKRIILFFVVLNLFCMASQIFLSKQTNTPINRDIKEILYMWFLDGVKCSKISLKPGNEKNWKIIT